MIDLRICCFTYRKKGIYNYIVRNLAITFVRNLALHRKALNPKYWSSFKGGTVRGNSSISRVSWPQSSHPQSSDLLYPHLFTVSYFAVSTTICSTTLNKATFRHTVPASSSLSSTYQPDFTTTHLFQWPPLHPSTPFHFCWTRLHPLLPLQAVLPVEVSVQNAVRNSET